MGSFYCAQKIYYDIVVDDDDEPLYAQLTGKGEKKITGSQKRQSTYFPVQSFAKIHFHLLEPLNNTLITALYCHLGHSCLLQCNSNDV